MVVGDVICKLWLPHVNKAVSTECGTKKSKLVKFYNYIHNSDMQKVHEISCKRKTNFATHFRLKTLQNVDTQIC